MSEKLPEAWLEADEVTIVGQNVYRITEDELIDVATAEYGPDGNPRPVTVREVLFGDGSGNPPMGIMPHVSMSSEYGFVRLSKSLEMIGQYRNFTIWGMSGSARRFICGKVRKNKLAEKKRKRAKQRRQARKRARG